MKSPEQSNNFFTESETLDGKLLEIVVDYEKTDQVLDILLRQYHSNDYVAKLAAALKHRAAEAQRVLKVADAARRNRDMGGTSIVAAVRLAS